MLKLSLYGFDIYQIKSQFVIFYLNYQLPFHNQIFSLSQAVKFICNWIDVQSINYHGPTSEQFADKAKQFRSLIKE